MSRRNPVRPPGACDIGTPGRQAVTADASRDAPFRQLFEAANVGLGLVDRRDRLTAVNPKFCEILGYTRAELLRMSTQDLVHPDDLTDSQRQAKLVNAGRLDRLCGERRYRRKDGSFVCVDISASVIRDVPGLENYSLGVIVDITARRATEALLDAQRQVLEAISLGMPLGESMTMLLRALEAQFPGMMCSLLVLDADGVRLHHCAAPSLPHEYCRAIDGYRVGPQAGSCGSAAYHGVSVVVEDIAVDPRWDQTRDIALRHGLRACWSSPILDFRRQVLGTFAVYYARPCAPADDHVRGVELATHIAAIAITKQREDRALRDSHARLSTILGAVPACVKLMDREGRILDMNRSGLEMVEADSVDEVRGQFATSYVDPEYHEEAMALMRRVSAGDGGSVEFAITGRRGTHRWLEMSAVPLCDDTGAVTSMLCVARDVTERKSADAAMKRVLDQYRALADKLQTVREEERTRIAREIHDVLAQDLTRLKIDLALLVRQLGKPVDDARRKTLLAQIESTKKRVSATMTSAQKLATELRPVILDSAGLPVAVEWQVRDMARVAGLHRRVRLSRDLPALSREQADALFRVLQESVTNVVRHARAKQVDVRLLASGACVVLTVRDDGCGIPASALADPRALGLMGMRERMQSLGGALEIAANAGSGTCVTARLPCPSPSLSP